MYSYRKRLFFPVHVDHPDPELGEVLLEHYAGKDSEFSAAVRYLNQRTYLTDRYLRELLGLLAAEELGHMEMLSVAVSKLGLAARYVNSRAEPWHLGYLDPAREPKNILERAIKAEERAREKYEKTLLQLRDTGLVKMTEFLIRREEVHQRLLRQALHGLDCDERADNGRELIYAYKMSLQVLE
ncbi:putative manganese catalase [Peptococcaceae bacterium CEB3]|nr:putative manganese catalase [Peptococcaceae bacterium CEB3]